VEPRDEEGSTGRPVERMTPGLLDERDPDGEVRGWLKADRGEWRDEVEWRTSHARRRPGLAISLASRRSTRAGCNDVVLSKRRDAGPVNFIGWFGADNLPFYPL